MIAQIKAELVKIRSTRTTIALILAMIALIVLITLLAGLLTHSSGLAGREDQREMLSLSSITGVFAALAGVLLVTSEYRFGTIRPTILFNPVRSHVLAAKVSAGALAGLVFGVLGEAIGWAIGYAIIGGRGISVVLGDALLDLGGDLLDQTLALGEHVHDLGAPATGQSLGRARQRVEQRVEQHGLRHPVSHPLPRALLAEALFHADHQITGTPVHD